MFRATRANHGYRSQGPHGPSVTPSRRDHRRRGVAPTHLAFTGFLLVSLLASSWLQGCAGVGRAYETTLVLGDVAAGDDDSFLKRRRPEPEREALEYRVEDREYVADIYRPAQPRRGHMLLVHGFTEEGRRDPRLASFARTLARVGFTVFVPEVDGLRDYSISSREVEVLADALRFSTGEEGPAAGEHSAVLAFSLAVGPAMLAAKEPDVAGRVSFIVAVGGYYDLPDTLRYVTTGVDAGSGEARPPPPQREGRWAVLLSQLHWLESDQDRELLERMAQRRLESADAPVHDLRRQLGEEGRAVYSLVNNRDPEQLEALLAELPERLEREIRSLDLSTRDLSRLEGDVILIHGPDDRVIPISHSERLEQALPDQHRTWFYRAGGLGHVDVTPGLRDGVGLWRATWRVLREGERQAATTDLPRDSASLHTMQP